MKSISFPRLSVFLIATALLFSAGVSLAHDHGASSAEPTVLITGANRGIGLEFATQYAAAGWQVIGTARNPDSADALAETGAKILQLDVTDADSVAALAASLSDTPIDLLINNAGIFPRVNQIDEVDFDAVAMTLDVNVIGPLRVTKALLPSLEASKQKTVVNISSGLGSIAGNTSGLYYGYRESKAALNMFSRTLSIELAPRGFIVASVHPGWVQTDMGGANANLTPEESVSAMRETIEKLTPELNGTYWAYNGEQVPW